MFAGKAARCASGYEVRAYDEAYFVNAVWRHARQETTPREETK